MTISEISKYADFGAAVATIVGVIAAIVGVVFGWKQFSQTKSIQQEATAKHIYAQHLDRSISYPQYANPNPLESFEKNEVVAYEWFVSSMLNSFEEMLLFSKNRMWEEAIIMQLKYHVEHLRSPSFQEKEKSTYMPELVRLVERALLDEGKKL